MQYPPIPLKQDLLSLLHLHLTWYPLMGPQDAYKLLYQGIMGPEHLVATQQEFTRRLQAEFDGLLPDRDGRLFETVRPDDLLFRLNLRPYKAIHNSVDALISPLLQTSRSFHGDVTELSSAWAELIRLVERGELSLFAISEVRRLHRLLKKEDFPAVHHTEVYRQAYQPAYRLISAKFIQELGSHASS